MAAGLPSSYDGLRHHLLACPVGLSSAHTTAVYGSAPSHTTAGWPANWTEKQERILSNFRKDLSLPQRLLDGLSAHAVDNQLSAKPLPSTERELARWEGGLEGDGVLLGQEDTVKKKLRTLGDLVALVASVPFAVLNPDQLISVPGTPTQAAGQRGGTNILLKDVSTRTILAWVAAECKGPTVLLKQSLDIHTAWTSVFDGPEPHAIEGMRAICFNLSLQMQGLQQDKPWHHSGDGVRSLFGLLFGTTCFMVVELRREADERLSMLLSEVLGALDPPAPIPLVNNRPVVDEHPSAAPVIAIIIAAAMANAGKVKVAAPVLDSPSTRVPTSGNARPVRDNPQWYNLRPRKDSKSAGPSRSRAMCTTDGLFLLEALAQATATIKYHDPALNGLYPDTLLLLSFDITRTAPSTATDPANRPAPSDVGSRLPNDARAYLASRQEQDRDPGALLLGLPSEGTSSGVEIKVEEQIGSGLTSSVWRVSATRDGQPLAPCSLVAKLVTYDFTEAVVRETLFYDQVFPKLPLDVQELVPKYFGTYAPSTGGWYLTLLEDTGTAFSDWDYEDIGAVPGAAEAFAKLSQAGIEHWDQRAPNCTKDSQGRTRIIDFGRATLRPVGDL